jgi:hypothetical protein
MASTYPKGFCQISTAIRAAINQATGIALVAGQRRPTISTRAARIGRNARTAKSPTDISQTPLLKLMLNVWRSDDMV